MPILLADSFFTERYIPLKGDYLRALQEADLTMKAGNIKGRNLMLMHGTADTLVHQEHTLMLVRALVDQQVKFRHQVGLDLHTSKLIFINIIASLHFRSIPMRIMS